MIIKPEVSVIFTIEGYRQNANGLDRLRCSIQSILVQSFLDLELVLIDDQSCPLSSEICREFVKLDGRIKHFQSKHKLKRHPHALALCTGRYLCLMAKDDLWHPDTLLVLYNTLISHYLNCGMLEASLQYDGAASTSRAILFKHSFGSDSWIFEGDDNIDLMKSISSHYPMAYASVTISTAQNYLSTHQLNPPISRKNSLKSRFFYGPNGARKWAIGLWRLIQTFKNFKNA